MGFNWYPAKVLDVIKHQLVEPRPDSPAHGKRVLFVAQSGSRTWGFDDPHSDYDVKFVYAEPVSHYLTIADNPGHDTLDWQVNKWETSDLPSFHFHGWDLRKVLQLAHHGSHAAIELCRLPRFYTTDREFLLTNALIKLIEESWWPQGVFHGLLGVAESNWRKYLLDDSDRPPYIRRKKYLYVLHALLSASWMVQNRDKYPPFNIDELLSALNDESAARMWPDERRRVDELLEEKRRGVLFDGPRFEWFEAYYERTVKDLRSRPGYGDHRNRDRKPFDQFYAQFITAAVSPQC